MAQDFSAKSGSASGGKKYEEKLKKTQQDLETELKGHSAEVPEMGTDVDAFDTETDEAEEYSNELGVKDALKQRLQAVKKALGG